MLGKRLSQSMPTGPLGDEFVHLSVGELHAQLARRFLDLRRVNVSGTLPVEHLRCTGESTACIRHTYSANVWKRRSQTMRG